MTNTLGVSVHSGCYKQEHRRRGDFKQHIFISHSSEGWEVQDQATSRLSVWWEVVFLLCPHAGEGTSELSLGSLLSGHNPIHESFTLVT